jgi:hypothetical protein
MLQQLDDYDWKYAFEYAGEPDTHLQSGPSLHAQPPGSEVSLEPFSREDVEEIIGIREGENDGYNWLCAGRLKDGRWFLLSAGCDYTGWDCQAGGETNVSESRELLLQYGTSEDEAKDLGLEAERNGVVPATALLHKPTHGGYPE